MSAPRGLVVTRVRAAQRRVRTLLRRAGPRARGPVEELGYVLGLLDATYMCLAAAEITLTANGSRRRHPKERRRPLRVIPHATG